MHSSCEFNFFHLVHSADPLEMRRLYPDERTTSSIRLVWAEIPNTDNYAIRFDGRILVTSQTSYMLTGLNPGTVYNPVLLVRRMGMSQFEDVDNSLSVATRKFLSFASHMFDIPFEEKPLSITSGLLDLGIYHLIAQK